MRDVSFYDLNLQWRKFLNDLNTRRERHRVPFMVEDLPPDFVVRKKEQDSLIDLLLTTDREEPVAVIAALRGAGGYGKTTLARAICHDEDVQNAFDDGILWVTLGQTPGDLTGKVADLIETLSGERPGFTGLEAAMVRLKEALADRDILLVLDDVWDRAHLRPFLQGGTNCARLIVTRNRDTLPSEARRIQVGQMRPDEALRLIAAGLEPGRSEPLNFFAGRLGGWPLLIKLANGMLRGRVDDSGQSLDEALLTLNRALDKRGITAFDAKNPSERDQAAARTLALSLDMLEKGDAARLSELAVFPQYVHIPLATLEKFWKATGGLDEIEVEETCGRLFNRSLLLDFNLAARHISLHDAIWQYIVGLHQPETLRNFHATLVDAHRAHTNSHKITQWASMPFEEPYLWDQLASHLVAAGRGAELIDTLKDLRFASRKAYIRNSWAVESDLRAAQKVDADDVVLTLLTRRFTQAGHLLDGFDVPTTSGPAGRSSSSGWKRPWQAAWEVIWL
jgi:hypothetical protein